MLPRTSASAGKDTAPLLDRLLRDRAGIGHRLRVGHELAHVHFGRGNFCRSPVLQELRQFEILGVVFQANVLEVLTQSNDAVIEAHVRRATAEFMHFERTRSLLADIEALAIAVWSQEYVVLHSGVHGLREIRL